MRLKYGSIKHKNHSKVKQEMKSLLGFTGWEPPQILFTNQVEEFRQDASSVRDNISNTTIAPPLYQSTHHTTVFMMDIIINQLELTIRG